MENPSAAIERCRQQERAFCTAACPFSLDVHDFTEKLKRGSLQAAYKTYQNAVGFPMLVAALCPAPCRAVCPLAAHNAEIDLPGLERAAVEYCRSRDPVVYNVRQSRAASRLWVRGLRGWPARCAAPRKSTR